jgi:hypothetical protein
LKFRSHPIQILLVKGSRNLADPCLADDRDEFPVAPRRKIKGTRQRTHFAISANKSDQPSGCRALPPATRGTDTDQFTRLYWLVQTRDDDWAERIGQHGPLRKVQRLGGDQDRIRARHLVHASGKMRPPEAPLVGAMYSWFNPPAAPPTGQAWLWSRPELVGANSLPRLRPAGSSDSRLNLPCDLRSPMHDRKSTLDPPQFLFCP